MKSSIKFVTVIQARTGSSRLPDKVLLPLRDKPLLIRMVERVAFSKLAGQIVVATSDKSSDDIIEKICNENGIEVFRGSEQDLLDRHYKTGLKYSADVVLKIPSDCPLIDFRIIDEVIIHFMKNIDQYDFVSNLHPATFPDGNDVEIMSFEALSSAWNEAKRKLEREHTTPYFWENPDKFSIGNVEWNSGKNFSQSHRWTIDYPEDYQFIKTVYDELYPINNRFSMEDILNLLEIKPEIAEINSKFAGKYWYENHLNELKNIDDYKNQRVK